MNGEDKLGRLDCSLCKLISCEPLRGGGGQQGGNEDTGGGEGSSGGSTAHD